MPMDEELLNVLKRQEADEQAVAAKAALEERILQGLKAGSLMVGEETLTFSPRELLDGRVRLTLPDNLAAMDPELAALKYPSNRRPDPLFCDRTGSVSLGLTHTQAEVRGETIVEFSRAMQQTLQRLQSSAQFMDEGVKVIHGRPVSWFEFIAPAIDGDIYNLMAFLELEGRALLVGLNCPDKVMSQWRPVAKGILATLEIIETPEAVAAAKLRLVRPSKEERP